MKRIFSLSLVAGLTLVVVSVASVAIVNAQAGMVSSILNRMTRGQQSLKTLRANIVMEKYNSQIREKDTYQGIILYIHETLAVAKGNYQLYRPRTHTVIEGNTRSVAGNKNSDVLELMSMSATQLRTRFGEAEDVREETLGDGVWTQHLKVTPKGAASYKYIELWVDKEGMPVQTKMVEKNDDATTVRLMNIEKNQSIPMDQFKLNLDSNVKRVKG